MVRHELLLSIIEEYVTKCSNDEAKRRLSLMTQEEKNSRLDTLLNPAEKEAYNRIIAYIEKCWKNLEMYESVSSDEFIQEAIAVTEECLEASEEDAFYYEKRIVQGHKPHIPQPVSYDLSEFTEDPQYTTSELSIPNTTVTEFGQTVITPMEQQQMDSQEKLEFTEKEMSSLKGYFGGGSKTLNRNLYENIPLNDNLKEQSKNLSSAIRKTSLEESIIVYHGGKFDYSKVVGDDITFKGFTSCSYQKSIAEGFTEDGFIYKIALPKGSHGFTANAKINGGEPLSYFQNENELLLDKNHKGRIVDIDYDAHVVTVMPI